MQALTEILYNSATSLLNPDLDLFLLPLLHKEPLPPKLLLLMPSSKSISNILHKALFSQQENFPKSLNNFSGLTLSRFLLNSSPLLLLETHGQWDYNSELLAISLSPLIIIAMEYREFDDYEIEKLFDIVIRLETQTEAFSYENSSIRQRNIVFYLANTPENLQKESLEHKILENLRRKWSLFAKTEQWSLYSLEALFSIEIQTFNLKNHREYIPIGFLTKSNEADMNLGELNCIGGLCEEILRLLGLKQEYLSMKEVRKRCFSLQTQRIFKVLFNEFQGEIVKLKDKKTVDFKGFSNEILNQFLSRFDLRTQGLRDLAYGDFEVLKMRKELKEKIIKELLSVAYSQKALIIASADEIFAGELKKVLKVFKETKQVSYLMEVKVSVLERIETSLRKNELDSFKDIARNSPLIRNSEDLQESFTREINESTNDLEKLMERFQAKIQVIVEKERKDLLQRLSDFMSKELAKIIETSLTGEDLLLGKEFWERLSKKLSQSQEKLFSKLKILEVNLGISEGIINGDIERLIETQQAFIVLELEKKKYNLEDFFIKSLQKNVKIRGEELVKSLEGGLFEKNDENIKELLLKDLRIYAQGILERMEKSLKAMRWIELYEGKLWLCAEDITLILQALYQAFEKEFKALPENFKNLEKKRFFKRIGILSFFIVIFLIVSFVSGFGGIYMRICLGGISLGLGGYFAKVLPIMRKKNIKRRL